MGCQASTMIVNSNEIRNPQIVGGCALCRSRSVRVVVDAPAEVACNTRGQSSRHRDAQIHARPSASISSSPGRDLQESLKTIKGFEKFLDDMGKWLGGASENLSSMSADQLNEQWDDSYADLVDELSVLIPVSKSFSQTMTNVQKSTRKLENTCSAEVMNIETNMSTTRIHAQVIQAGLVVAGVLLAPFLNVISVIGRVVDILKEVRTTSIENKWKNSKELKKKIQHVRNKISKPKLQMRLKWLDTCFKWLLDEVDKLAARTRAGRHTDKHETNELRRIIDFLNLEVKGLQLAVKRLRDCILDLVGYMSAHVEDKWILKQVIQ